MRSTKKKKRQQETITKNREKKRFKLSNKNGTVLEINSHKIESMEGNEEMETDSLSEKKSNFYGNKAIWRKIFLYLDIRDILACSRVDKQWNTCIYETETWGKLLERDYGAFSINPKEDYIAEYIATQLFLKARRQQYKISFVNVMTNLYQKMEPAQQADFLTSISEKGLKKLINACQNIAESQITIGSRGPYLPQSECKKEQHKK
jgi:bisphosphoglycerate-dependent phosphoglycerate mutase